MTDGAGNNRNKGAEAIRARLDAAEIVTPAPFDYLAVHEGRPDAKAKRQRGRKTAGKGTGTDEQSDKPPEDGAPLADEAPEGPEDVSGSPPPYAQEDLDRARECAELDQNDRDNGRRLLIHSGNNLKYVAGMGWLTWRGTHWQRDDGELLARLMAQNIVDFIKLESLVIAPSVGQRALLALADRAAEKPIEERTPEDVKLIMKGEAARGQLAKKRDARRKFAVASGNAAKTGAMLTQAASLAAIEQDLLDADRMAFNCRNRTLKFRREVDLENPDPDSVRHYAVVDAAEHDRADHITKRADVDFDETADCPAWRAFLERVQPDPEMRRFLQVFHAYAAMIGGNDEQKITFHYGSGANGKSVFLETLGRLCGSYRATVSPETIAGEGARQGQQASPDIARLYNTRLVIVDELPRGVPLKENLLKAVSGGSRLIARFLQKEFFEFDPLFTAVMSGNDMPEISGTDNGIWRRVLLVEWGVTIPRHEQVPFGEMLARFDGERSGILNWLIEGLKLYLASGLEPYVPEKVTAFTNAYREERDPVGQFARACLTPAIGSNVQGKVMYKAYCDWCEEAGFKPWQQTGFGRRMTALSYTKTSNGKNVFYSNVHLDAPDRFDTGPRANVPDTSGL